MKWVQKIALILLIISLGTIIDYFIHQTSPYFSVPPEYFPHKIFYGTLWGFVGYLVFKKYTKTFLQTAIIISATPAILLQTMYFIQKHQLPLVILLFLLLHFLMFFLPAFFICKKFKNVFL